MTKTQLAKIAQLQEDTLTQMWLAITHESGKDYQLQLIHRTLYKTNKIRKSGTE